MNLLLVYEHELAYQTPPEGILAARSSEDWQLRGVPNAALIAIVDDDDWVRRSVERLIKSVGFRTQTFISAEDYVASAKHDEIACVILDLRLPGMSGLDLQARLLAEHNQVPIIFFSAHDEQKTRSRAIEAGAIAYLVKPVSDKTLLEAIDLAIK
jgi:FixJ family two-component response regulator